MSYLKLIHRHEIMRSILYLADTGEEWKYNGTGCQTSVDLKRAYG